MSSKSFSLTIKDKIKPYNKTIKVDSDKSISIRSFLFGSISNGISSIRNVLESEDVFSTINCLKKLGVKIVYKKKQNYQIFGKGLGSYNIKSNSKLNFGNSGTLARLILGIITSTPNMNLIVSGDKSLNKRNMKKLIQLMNEFGAEFFPKKKYFFPLRVLSSNYPIGINYQSGTSAQLKSAVILAGLNSYGLTQIIEKQKSRDHTENMLKKNNKAMKIVNKKNKIIKVIGKESLDKFSVDVPGDPSSAAFFTALTLLKENSVLKIKNVGLNPTRIGFYELLKKSGANIKFLNIRKVNNEKVGDILVKSSNLKPLRASKNYITSTMDEYPILFVMSALIKGKSYFYNLSSLKNKESNRVLEMQKILKQIGIYSKLNKDKLFIIGKNIHTIALNKVKVNNVFDHRIAMASAILALLTGVKIVINGFDTVKTSSPNFLKIIKTLGGKFEKKKN